MFAQILKIWVFLRFLKDNQNIFRFAKIFFALHNIFALHKRTQTLHTKPTLEETIQNSTSAESPIEYPTIYSPLNYETVGSNYVLTVNHKNQVIEVPTFFAGEISDNVKNYGKAKVLWMSQLSNPDCNEVPIACTLLTNTGIGTKIKCLEKIYLHSKAKVYGEAYGKLADAQFSATAKPKGSNSDAIKKWTSGRNRLTGSLEICQFDKVDMVFDVLSKNSASVFVGEDDFLIWEANCSFNSDKGKYEPVTGGLKQPNEMIDFYARLGNTFLLIILTFKLKTKTSDNVYTQSNIVRVEKFTTQGV